MNVGRDAVLAGLADTATPPSGRRERTMRGTEGPASVRRPRNAKADRYRDGASKDADASVFDASDSGASRVARRDPGRSGAIRNMRLSARHPPRSGEGKREDYGRTPAPSKAQRPRCFGCLTIEYENVARTERRVASRPGTHRRPVL